jgi:23S rRNA pseudouridine1911/1915/1917 synthase
MLIQSGFRPFGVGRKAVRPVLVENGLATNAKQKEVALDKAVPYQTEIISVEPISTFTQEDVWHFHLRIKRGFRHQIRCHLAWLGFPIVGDILYGGFTAEYLALTAQGLSFLNPADGKPLQFSI